LLEHGTHPYSVCISHDKTSVAGCGESFKSGPPQFKRKKLEVKVLPVAKVSPVVAGLWALLRLIVAVIMAVIAIGIGVLAIMALVVANPGEVIAPAPPGIPNTAVAIVTAGVAIAVAIIVAPAIAALKAE